MTQLSSASPSYGRGLVASRPFYDSLATYHRFPINNDEVDARTMTTDQLCVMNHDASVPLEHALSAVDELGQLPSHS